MKNWVRKTNKQIKIKKTKHKQTKNKKQAQKSVAIFVHNIMQYINFEHISIGIDLNYHQHHHPCDPLSLMTQAPPVLPETQEACPNFVTSPQQ